MLNLQKIHIMKIQKIVFATVITFSLFACSSEEQSTDGNTDATPVEESIEESVEVLDASWQEINAGELMPEQKVVFE